MRHDSALKQQWWRMGLALAVIGMWAAVGWAQPGMGHEAWSGGTPLPALLNAAGVADEQKVQIKAIAAAIGQHSEVFTASYMRRIRRSLMRCSQGAIQVRLSRRLPRSVVSSWWRR